MGENVSLIDGHIDNEIKQTNYERIKAMSIEEMALFLANETYRIAKPIFDVCGYGIELQFIFALRKQWLENEVETE